MEEMDWIILKEVDSLEDAEALDGFLTENGFTSKVVEEKEDFDATVAVTHPHKITVQILRDDLEEANKLLNAEAQKNVELLADHYLHSFTDEELIAILMHEDDWSGEDVVFARKLLEERKVVLNETEIESSNELDREEKDKPESARPLALAVGLFFALLGGLFGIGIGWFLMTLKKTDRFGNRVYSYDSKTRNFAHFIFWTGITVILTFFIYFVLRV